MKQLAAIAFSLLLIVAQTFAVQALVSGGGSMAKSGCCGDDCHCCVSQSGATSVPPVEPAAFTAAQNQLVFPPVAAVIFTLASPAGALVSASSSNSCLAVLLLFRRNCALLI